MSEKKGLFGNFRKSLGDAATKAAQKAQQAAEELAARSVEMKESSLPKLEILDEINVKEYEEQIEIKRYPLDNRGGNDTIEACEEISKTVTSEVNVEEGRLREAGLNVAGLRFVGAQIASNVSKKTSHKSGEEITRSQSLTFKAAPGKFTIFTVTWTQRIREGTYIAKINDERVEIPYRTVVELSYEVRSETEE